MKLAALAARRRAKRKFDWAKFKDQPSHPTLLRLVFSTRGRCGCTHLQFHISVLLYSRIGSLLANALARSEVESKQLDSYPRTELGLVVP